MLKKRLKILIVFAITSAWIFTGWPQIFNFPPKTPTAQAAAVISFVTSCTGTTNCTAANSVGDLEIAYAGRNGSATAPSLPAGWTTVTTASINGTSSADSASRMACKVTTGANEASGTFTNAGTLIIHVYRGQIAGTTATCASAILGTPSSFTSTVNTTTVTETFKAISSQDASSWIVGFGYCSACTAAIATAPAGMTNHASVTGPPGMGGHDTNATAASFGGANVTLTTAGRVITTTVEIKATVVDTPAFDNGTATYNNDVSVTITVANPASSVICYTTDGSTPAATTPGTCSAGSTYSGAVNITATGTVLKAIGTKAGFSNSTVQSATYTLTVGAITSSPGAGTYAGTQSVTLSIATTASAVAHYTTDGSAVSCSSATYSGAISVSVTTTVKAIGCKTNYNSDTAISDLYTITVPAAPTNVAASDGTATDKVTITWTKSTGATDYHVWRDTTDLGAAGDVATFDDTGAGAPTVTAGTASATDGSATDKVTLSISGASASNGTTYTYKVVASNAVGNSVDSTTDTGYRGVGALTYQWKRSAADSDATYSTLAGATTAPYDDTTAPAPTITAGTAAASDGANTSYVSLSLSGVSANAGAGRYFYATVSATGASSADTNHDRGYIGVGALTYQWQRSAADSDASYSNIAGATTASYNDTGAPADGSGRYYKAVINATGATQQTSASDRGYRSLAGISLATDGSLAFSFVAVGTATDTTASGLNDVQTISVDNGPVNLDIKSTAFSDGTNTWALGAANGTDQVKWEFSLDGSSWTVFAAANNYYTLDTSVAQGQTRNVYFRLTMPSSTTHYNQFSATVTILASVP